MAGFRLKGSRKAIELIGKVIGSSGKVAGDLNFIFTDDSSLLKINVEFLNHDYFTDVITFDYSVNNTVSGEVYISIDTVRANALNYNISFEIELLRVMIHGVLHLLGYDDRTDDERGIMREMEDRWLAEFK